MRSTFVHFSKGVMTGMVIGTAVGLTAKSAAKNQGKFKRNTGRALHAFSSFVDNMANMVK